MDSVQSLRVFGLPAEKGRWIFVLLGLLLLLCLGAVYSWSIFRQPLEELFSISATQSLLPFMVLLVLYSLLMPVAGFYIDKVEVSKIAAFGGIVMGIGYILSGFASSLTALTITYGGIAGAGVGIAYGVPIAVAAKWFPDKKGLAVGLTVIGFGLSPVVTAPLAKSAIAAYGVLTTFIILGLTFTVIILAISTNLKLPPKGWTPKGWTPPATRKDGWELERENLWRSTAFYTLWICYTIGTFVGLSAIGISSSVAQEIIKLDANTAAFAVSLFALFNGVGRPLFGWLTDRLQPKGAAIISYVLILIASILMLHAREGQAVTYIIAFALFWLCLGGWLAIAPTTTLSLFNPENYAKNYGLVFTAYGVGALLGNLAAGQIRDLFGSYTYAFYPTAILAVVGIAIAQFNLHYRSYKIEPAKANN
ncbi:MULTISPECIES: OFA family MFS transporter [Aerosakkonema]|uniref:L-lactate MFS transporter n=1 Tax=Aerosakkonema TaxID=1246629 RepID=UPI0035B9D1CA